jgi:opacity protein-like surface antigen
MKKVILSFVIVSLTTLGVNAQVNFGIKAGVNISSLTGDDASDVKSLVGPYGGAFVNIPVSTMFSVQPELLYSMEGAKESGTDTKIILGYINIPVMLKYTNPSGFTAELGPQVGILSSAKAKADGETEDVKEFLKSTNFSLGIGAGFNFTPNIGVGLRYNLGLSNINDESGGDLKTSNFAIGVHYSFGGGGTTKE